MGTPHRGSSLASYAATMTQVANLFVEGSQLSRFTGSMRASLVDGLKKSAPELRNLADDFRSHTQHLKITTFIKQKAMSGMSRPVSLDATLTINLHFFAVRLICLQVVDGDSANVGASNERKIPMEGCDHCNQRQLKIAE